MIRSFEAIDESDIRELGKCLNGSFDYDKVTQNEKILVYEKDGKAVGFVDYMKLYEVIEILYIVVREDCRRLGIGEKLLNYLFENNDFERSILEVKSLNVGAIEFYKHMGYKPIRIIKNYTSDGVDAISMEKVK